MFTTDYVMPIISPDITAKNCDLNLFPCFSMVYTRVKLSLIVMYSLTSLSTVNVYDLVRFNPILLIMFTTDYVMPIILPDITANNCDLNLFPCFSMVYTRVKLSLIVMYSLTSLSTVNVYDLVRFNPILPGGGGGGNIRPLLFFLHHPKTAQGIKLKFSDFKDTLLRHILQVKPVR